MNKSLIISKTLSDTINGLEPSQDLMKALMMGETKVMDGITYVVKQTPSGLGWRVLDKKKKKRKSKKKILKANDLFENKDFPSLSEMEFVKKMDNSSTGSEMIKDKVTDQLYILKRGASPEHIREEFLANSIYKILDSQVPDLKLYEEGNEVFLLSRFIEDTTPSNDVMDELLMEDVMDDFVADCLLGNWDIYKNDNIRVDNETGNLVRVDNGGSLRFSAQGRDKSKYFLNDVDEIESMIENNPEFAPYIDEKKIKSQIRWIEKHRNEILSIIEDPDLRTKMSNRMDDLQDRISKKDPDPYRVLKERELKKALENSFGKVTHTGGNGWTFLSEICKLRGFDLPPTVLDEKEFEKQRKKSNTMLIHRGLTGQSGKTANDFMKEFTDSEECFYGTQAMYGAGIYAALNKTKEITDPPNNDYEIALQYAGYQKDGVMDIIVSPDVKVIYSDDLDKMMNEEFFGDDFKEKKVEYDNESDALNKLLIQKEAEEKIISDGVKSKLGWSDKAYRYLKRSKPEEIYGDLKKNDFLKSIKYFSTLVSAINGRIDKLDDLNYAVHLPNSNNVHIINKNVASIALKQKNSQTTPYNYHFVTLKEFIHKNHFKVIQDKISEKVKEETRSNPKLKIINKKISSQEAKIAVLANEIKDLSTTGKTTLNEVMAEIAQNNHQTHRGFYAAIKGYDMVIQRNGWGGSTDFAVILNRSKMLVRKFD